MKRATRCAFILVLLLILGAAAAYFAAPHLLAARGVRAQLARELAHLLGGNAAISPVHWNGLTISSSAFLKRESPAVEIRAPQVSTPFGFADLWQNRWKIDKLTITDAQVALGAFAVQQLDRVAIITPEFSSPPAENSPLREIEFVHANVLYGDVPQNAGELRDARAKLSWQDGAGVVLADGGTFRHGNFPAVALVNCKLNYTKPNLRIERAAFTLGDNSSIEVTGEINFDPQNQIRATGAVFIANAIVKNVATLRRIADFSGRADLGQVKIDNLTANYDVNAQALTVKNFAGEAKQIFVVRGDFVVEGDKLNGEFELGLAPDVVEKFPGAREEIFKSTRDGYMWTAVSVTGRVDDLRDNLRPRLLRAAQDHHADAKVLEAIEEL